MKTSRERFKEYANRYREAGLVSVTAWIPAEHKAKFLEECRQLRETHLAKLALQRAERPLDHFDNAKEVHHE